MPDFTKSRRTAKLAAKVLTLVQNEALFMSAPFDPSGAPVEQPTAEEKAEFEAEAAVLAKYAGFELELAKVLPDADSENDSELDEVTALTDALLDALNA